MSEANSMDCRVVERTQESCAYPDCKCPLDAPEDTNWCAIGLPRKQPNTAAAELPTHDAQGHEMGWVLINGNRYWRPVIKVAVIGVDGTKCTVPVGALMDMIEGGAEYTVEIKTMRLAEFERMEEFTGW